MADRNEAVQQNNSPTFDKTLTTLETGKGAMSGTPYSDYMSQMIKAGEQLENTQQQLVISETNAWNQLTEQAELLTSISPDASRTEAIEINNSINTSLGDFASSAVQNREILKDNTRAWFEGVGDLISDESFAKTAGNELWYSMSGNDKQKYKQVKDIIDNANTDVDMSIFFSDRVQDLHDSGQLNTGNENFKGSYFSDSWYDAFTNDAYDSMDRRMNKGFVEKLIFGSPDGSLAGMFGNTVSFLVWDPLKFMTVDLAKNTETFIGSMFDGEEGIAWGAGVGAALGAASWIPFFRGGSVISKAATEEAAIIALDEIGTKTESSIASHLTNDGLKIVDEIDPKINKDLEILNKKKEELNNIASHVDNLAPGQNMKKSIANKLKAPNGERYKTARGLKNRVSKEIEIVDQAIKEQTEKIGKLFTDNPNMVKKLVDDGVFGQIFDIDSIDNVLTYLPDSKAAKSAAWRDIKKQSTVFKNEARVNSKKGKKQRVNEERQLLNKEEELKDIEWKKSGGQGKRDDYLKKGERRKITKGIVKEETSEIFESKILNDLYTDADGLVDMLVTDLPSNHTIKPGKGKAKNKAEKVVEDIKDEVGDKAEEELKRLAKTKKAVSKRWTKWKNKRAAKKGQKIASFQDAEKVVRRRGWLSPFGKRRRTGDIMQTRWWNPLSWRGSYAKNKFTRTTARFRNALPGAAVARTATELFTQFEYAIKTDQSWSGNAGEMWLAFFEGDDLTSQWNFDFDNKPYIDTPDTDIDVVDETEETEETNTVSTQPTFNLSF